MSSCPIHFCAFTELRIGGFQHNRGAVSVLFLSFTIPLPRFRACSDSAACAFVHPHESTHPHRRFRVLAAKRLRASSVLWESRPCTRTSSPPHSACGDSPSEQTALPARASPRCPGCACYHLQPRARGCGRTRPHSPPRPPP